MTEKQTSATRASIVFPIATILLVLVVLELVVSYVFLLSLRIDDSQPFTKSEPSYLSLINIPYAAGNRLGLFNGGKRYRRENEPSPRYVLDPDLGYRPKPATYRETYSRRDGAEWSHFRVKHTSLADGSRWTGDHDANPRSTVYIFGDSFVEGMGVNDEQTFSYLLQQARRDLRVRLFAVRGYGMTQAYILFNRLRSEIGPNDVVILGYADFYDARTVVSPSWLRYSQAWPEPKEAQHSADQPGDELFLPKASIDDEGKIEIQRIQWNCTENQAYCSQDDPQKDETARVTAALVNEIAKGPQAKTILLHIAGTKSNSALDLFDETVIQVSALRSDFDYFIRDDIEGFDDHPGPYWHYAISTKLLEIFDQQNAGSSY
jgi:hypothetical protein